ncbi:exported hypothetical protein [Bradyrhizobium sp. STM 3843]|uniref:hypothetical protein n=1 Tax=Bradyrhizobium sp. STM 3843 TaxID=551947 RepID=UPI000240A9D4|nr:hypothetical protein [Bradyrhizobium sp. STM 3843]CCE05068.1 exported hypothetical protein [Bradyrhizobium sp. STM 3843]
MRLMFGCCLAAAAALATGAQASTIYPGASPVLATNSSFSVDFGSAATAGQMSFVLDGYQSLDGQNFYEDDFSVRLNGNQIFLGTFNLGGGSDSGTQANIYSNPFNASLSNPTNNGTSITSGGGKEVFSFAGIPLNIGSNQLTFSYLSLADGHAGFQGLGDEGWGIADVNVNISATPLPASWTMMLIGFAGLGALGCYRKMKTSASPLAVSTRCGMA